MNLHSLVTFCIEVM